MINFLKTRFWLPVVILLLIMFAAELTSAVQQSQIIDEAPHIAAGYSYVKLWDFHLNPEHPPLLKMLAGTPLLFMNLDPLSANPGWQSNNQWYAGQWLLYHNQVDHFWLLFWGRLPIMLLSIVLGLILFKWAKSLFGVWGGLLALLLYVFDPTTIAHSRWITTDLGIALFIIATLYFFSRYLNKPTVGRTIVFALVFALALLAKFSAVILIPLILLYFLIAKWQGWPKKAENQNEPVVSRPVGFWLLLLITIVVTAVTVWAVYGFELKTPASDPEVSVGFAPGKSQGQFDEIWLKFVNTVTDTDTSVGQLTESLAKTVPIPAYTWFKGFIVLANHNYWGHTSYLLGRHSDVGWWHYFIVAFLVKTPLVTLILTVLAFSLGISWLAQYRSGAGLVRSKKPGGSQSPPSGFWKKLRALPIDWYIIVLTPLLYFGWTLTSKLNLGVRHLLPVYPFLFLWIGSLVKLKPPLPWRKTLMIGLAVLLAFYVYSSVAIYPHYLSYFNEAVGGPKQGYKYLLDSNLDWGQDLIALKKYLEKNNVGKIYLHYFGTADPKAYGIEHESPPTNDVLKRYPGFKGTVAISLSGLYSKTGEYSWLLKYEPVARIGYSMYVYDIR